MVIRISRFLLRLVELALAIAAAGLAVGAWLLLSGPVSVPWLTPYLERALSDQATVAIDDTWVRLGDDRLLEFTAVGVRLSDASGRPVGELPEVAVGLSTSAILLEGDVALTRIEAATPRLVLTRREDGSIGVGDLGQTTNAAAFDIGLLLNQLPTLLESERWRYLEAIRMSGGELVLEDRKLRRSLRVQDAELSIVPRTDGADARLAFKIEQATGLATVDVAATYRRAGDRIEVEVAFADLLPAELADYAPDLPLAGIRVPLRGKVRRVVVLDGDPSATRFDVTAGSGTIELPQLGLEPLQVSAIAARGELAADLGGLVVDRLSFSAGGAHLGGSGEATWRDGAPTLNADLEAENVTAADLERYWPPDEGREARKWVTENITAGVVPKARATLRFGPGELGQKPLPEHTLDGEFVFEDLTVRYLDTMPPLVGVDGRATFSGQRMDFDVAAGHVGDLVVDQGGIVITGIGIKGRSTTQLEIATTVRGPVEQALDLIDRPPLGFAAKVGIAPETTAGRVTTNLRIGMPLHRELEPSEVRVAAEATIEDGAIAGAPINLSDGQLALTIDNQGADLSGTASIEDVPLKVELRENFDEGASGRRYRIEGTPEVAALERLGLALPIAADGSIGVEATITEAASRHEVRLALDLTPAAIDAPEIGWRKQPGEPGSLEASLVIPANGPMEVLDFRLKSPTLRAEGDLIAQVSPFQIERVRLDRVQLGQSDGRLVLRHGDSAGYDIEIDATTLDLTAFLAGENDDGLDATTPVRLEVRADRAILDGRTFDQVRADLVRDPDGWRSADVVARLPEGGEVKLTLVPDGPEPERRLRLVSSDAGSLLRALHETGRIEGGQLTLDAVLSQQRPSLVAEGMIEASSFRILDAPILARLLTLASPTGVGDLLTGEGLWLDRLEMPFALRGDELQLKKGRMYGSQIGLTFEGKVDLDADTLDVEGTVVPLYGINWTIGQIPVIGQFLRGNEGEGAFAASYSLRGPVDDPTIRVNPLTALAPGFLRELFAGLRAGTLEPPEMPPSHDR